MRNTTTISYLQNELIQWNQPNENIVAQEKKKRTSDKHVVLVKRWWQESLIKNDLTGSASCAINKWLRLNVLPQKLPWAHAFGYDALHLAISRSRVWDHALNIAYCDGRSCFSLTCRCNFTKFILLIQGMKWKI